MNRRDAIKRTTLLLGGTLSASAVLGVMSGCKADPTLAWEPQFFTIEAGNIVEQIAEHIIPRTETPGATDAGVPSFIDRMLAGYDTDEGRTKFLHGIAQVDADAEAAFGKKFVSLTPDQQLELLNRYDREAFGDGGNRDHFFRRMKELTVLGYCTSEAGATEHLEYDPAPGDYKGCIPFSEVGKTWAT